MRSLRSTLKKFVRSAGGGQLNRLLARWQLAQNSTKSPEPVHQEIACEGAHEPAHLLMSCKSGVLHYRDGALYRILEGDFYGLSPFRGRWYLSYRMTELVSQIVSFELRGGRACDVRCELPILNPGMHQIDFCGDHLLVADTTKNRLARYDCGAGLTARGVRFAYPNGRAWRGRKSANYVHVNSVLCDGETTLLVFHNQTTLTKRNSEVVCLDRDLHLRGRRMIDAGCAHNVVAIDGRIAYCDSQNGDFVLGETRLPLGSFTRGIGVAEDRLFVGGSDFAPRANREHSTGLLHCLTRDASALLWKMRMPAVGGVYEVRLLGAEDQSLSEWFRKQRQTGQVKLERIYDEMAARERQAPVADVA